MPGAPSFIALDWGTSSLRAWRFGESPNPQEKREFPWGIMKLPSQAATRELGATFLTMLNTLGNANTFWVYAALNVLFILLTLWLVPETKHVSLEHIERNLMKGRKLREIGAHD